VPAQARLILLNNSLLESTFSDRARVVRIVGDLWQVPAWDGTDPDNCLGNLSAAFSFSLQAFMGLRRYEKNNAGQVLAVSPLENDADYSESQWLKTWQHLWWPRSEVNFIDGYTDHGCAVYVCPDVHTTGILDNDFVDGTGTINIETDCGDPTTVQCDSTQDERCNLTVDFPRPWHTHLDIKKRIPLREDQELALELNYIYSDIVSLVSPRVQVFGGIKVLMEY